MDGRIKSGHDDQRDTLDKAPGIGAQTVTSIDLVNLRKGAMVCTAGRRPGMEVSLPTSAHTDN